MSDGYPSTQSFFSNSIIIGLLKHRKKRRHSHVYVALLMLCLLQKKLGFFKKDKDKEKEKEKDKKDKEKKEKEKEKKDSNEPAVITPVLHSPPPRIPVLPMHHLAPAEEHAPVVTFISVWN